MGGRVDERLMGRCAGGLDVMIVVVECLLDGIGHILVYDLRGCKIRDAMDECREIFGRDLHLLCVELYGTFPLVMLVEQFDEVSEEFVLAGISHVLDSVSIGNQRE